jgi:hypothetical protein
MTSWAHRPDIHPGEIVEADEGRHDAGAGRLILLVTRVGWRERRADGTLWLNLDGVRITPADTRLDRCAVRVRLDPESRQPTDGAAHLPCVPDWSCLGCAQEWPCPTARAELPTRFAGRRRSLGAYLTACYLRACTDLPDEPSRRLHLRFLGWLRQRQ